MTTLGFVKEREILYANIRYDSQWIKDLPNDNWIVFTIADWEDEALISHAVTACIAHNVRYVCCAGELASYTDDRFDEIYVEQWVIEKKNPPDTIGDDPDFVTTDFFKNFDEGFWWASAVASHDFRVLNKLVCLDFTVKGVKDNILTLIGKINLGWLPD